MVRFGQGDTLVMADIPGLVEGASAGVGLGHAFLRHVERCRLLVHLLDLSGGLEGRDPLADFRLINEELARYSPELAARPMVVALNKIDLPEARANRERVEAALKADGFPVFAIAAATHEELDVLLQHLRERVAALPPPVVFTPAPKPVEKEAPEAVAIAQEDGVWRVRHAWLERQVDQLNLESAEALVRLHKLLDGFEVIDRLREMGVKDGDTVAIGDFEFDFVD